MSGRLLNKRLAGRCLLRNRHECIIWLQLSPDLCAFSKVKKKRGKIKKEEKMMIRFGKRDLEAGLTVTHRFANDFFNGGDSRQNLLDSGLTQGTHAGSNGGVANFAGRASLEN